MVSVQWQLCISHSCRLKLPVARGSAFWLAGATSVRHPFNESRMREIPVGSIFWIVATRTKLTDHEARENVGAD